MAQETTEASISQLWEGPSTRDHGGFCGLCGDYLCRHTVGEGLHQDFIYWLHEVMGLGFEVLFRTPPKPLNLSSINLLASP